MKYLKKVEANLRVGSFTATYASGATSTNHRVAQFFMLMESRGEGVEDVQANINLGKHVDFQTDWPEAQRILDTFNKETKQ